MKDASGNTISGSTVTVSFDGQTGSATSNSDGTYSVTLIPTIPITNAAVVVKVGSTTISNGSDVGTVTPIISSISPTSGLAAGGTTVIITGAGFTGATAVTFSGTAATSFTVNSATQITAVTPAGTAGAVNVVVTTPGGTVTQTGAFTYASPAYVVANLMENSTTPLGTYNGGYFTSDTAPNTSYTISGILEDENGNTITNRTGVVLTILPAPANGTISSTTVNANGTFSFIYTSAAHGPSSHNQQDQFSISVNGNPPIDFWTNSFEIVAAPTIASINPTSGVPAGGTSVTITGTGFTGATAVTFGGTAATSFIVNSDTQITAVTPAGIAGAENVAVTTPGGTTTQTGAYTYVVPLVASATMAWDAGSAPTPVYNTPAAYKVDLTSVKNADGTLYNGTVDVNATSGETHVNTGCNTTGETTNASNPTVVSVTNGVGTFYFVSAWTWYNASPGATSTDTISINGFTATPLTTEAY